MQLTKGQKEALMRKALSIVEQKKEQKKKELTDNWKPNHRLKAVLDNIREIEKLSAKLISSLKSAGFTRDYSSWVKDVDGHSFSISAYDLCDMNGVSERIEKNLRDECINAELEKETNYPDGYAILDEIELLNLSKDFNVDAFLAKYNAL